VGTRRITVGERRARLARRHRLVPSTRTDDVAAIADSVVALHSSDPVSVFLSALARMRHPSIAAVEAALHEATLRLCSPIAARYLLAGDYPIEAKMVRCQRFASVRRTWAMKRTS
jgi:hypothetical protein